MEKSKKSQSEKSFFKNPISSLKPDLKNFQNVFVISVFLVFIFIMAATAISVWLNKQAEPPTVEEYCANCKVLNVQENLLKSPSTALPVLRIFGKDIQVCQQACQNLRPIFNIQFECVPMAQASKETIKEVYTAFDFLKKAGNLAENKSTNKENLNEKKEEYIILSSTTQGKIKMAGKEKTPVFPNKQIDQRKADQATANLLLESNPKTVFFIGGYTLAFDGIPNKENICEVVNDPACPPKNSSFIPEENFFSLIKNCYAWVSGAGGSPSSGGGSGYSFIGGGSPGTSHNSNHWTPPPSSSPNPSSSHTHLPTTTFDPNFFDSGSNSGSDWNAITYNADGSATIGGGGPSQSAIDAATGFTTGSGATYATTGSWSGGTFNLGGASATGATGFNVAINIGNDNSGANFDISSGGVTFTSGDGVTVEFGTGEFAFQKPVIFESEGAGQLTDAQSAALWDMQALNQDFAVAKTPELAVLAAPEDNAWIASTLDDPSQNAFYALTHDGLATNSYVQTGAALNEDGTAFIGSSIIYITIGDASWDIYFYSGSPHTITTSDGSTWELTMMTRETPSGSEFLAYNETVDNGDGTFGNFVSYDPTNPNANEIAYGYQLVVDSPAGAAGTPGVPGAAGTPGVPGPPGPPAPPMPPANRAPSAAIGCYPSCEITTEETSFFSLRENHGDPDGDPVTCNWKIYRCQNSDCLENFLNSNVCSDLSSPVSQVGHYQARFVVNDGEFSVYAIPDPLDFYILQAITAMFDYDPEKPHYQEPVQFIDQSAGTGNPSGGNYNITDWDWTFEDLEGKEPTQTSNIQNPVITFIEDGIKRTTLKITDETNRFDTYSEDIYVRIPMPKWKEVHPGQE